MDEISENINEDEKTITTSLKHCARCGGNHKELIFHKFTIPAHDYTHWCMCPKLNEPILLIMTDESL